jgi:chemotaxis protein methyltransferase CheR
MALNLSSSLLLRRTQPISEEEFRKLRDFIYAKCGIWIDEKRKYLIENRFGSRLKELGLSSFTDYLSLLNYDQNKDKELAKLYELVTTNETSLFRDTKQLDGFMANILAPLVAELKKKDRLELNIWSAGCSSGEEPYTLAIMLCEHFGPEIKRWRVSITAIDLSQPMIAKCKEGVYSDYAFKTTPEAIKKKYFTPAAAGLKIIPDVARLVNFQAMNLNDTAALKRIPKSHVVFCRNVIIYFDEAMKRKAIGAFYDNLLPGGVLMLGHSETLHNISSAFKPKFIAGAVAYQKS